MRSKDPKYSWLMLLHDYWSILKGRRLKFFFFTALRMNSDLFSFAIAFFLGSIVDFFTVYTGGSLKTFYIYVSAITFLATFQVLFRFFAKFPMQNIAAELRKEVRIKAMSNIIDLDLRWHEKEETGSKIHKINVGGENIFEGLHKFSNEGINITTNLIASLIIFSGISMKYFAYSLAYIAIYLASEHYYNRQVDRCENELNKIKEKVSGKIHESASNILALKSLGLKDTFKRQTADYESRYYAAWLKKKKISQSKSMTVKVFAAFGYALFILVVGLDFASGLITLGSIMVFASYFGNLRKSLEEITNRIGEFIAVKSSIGRFMTIFRYDIIEEPDKLKFPKNWRRIEFKNISFRYKDKDVLRNFSLIINRGEKIGVAGSSGCGKSTIVKLILGLYRPDKGMILIDGKPISSYSHKSLTDSISVVLQESEMFNFTLIENITISSAKKDFKRFSQVSEIAQLSELIKKLPKGINTMIGEKGYKVSGGERQRIGIARALYKNSDLLILDEATSSLDSNTEHKIQKEIDKLDKTIITIAHRISTLKNTDRIIVMEKGKIIEEGTFKGLRKNKGVFYRLNKRQD